MKRMWDDLEILNLINKVLSEVIPTIRPKFEIVESLPETGENGIFYLLANGESGPNMYDEYIWLSSSESYELIGTEIDLTDYMTLNTEQTATAGKTINGLDIQINKIVFNGQTGRIDGPFLPYYTNDRDLGSETYKWRSGYFSGTVFCSEVQATYINSTWHKGSHFSPGIPNDNQDLGDSGTHKWNNLYLKGVISDGTNSASPEDLANLITYAKAQGWIS